MVWGYGTYLLQQDNFRAANQKDLSHKKTMIQKCLLLLLTLLHQLETLFRRGREGAKGRGKTCLHEISFGVTRKQALASLSSAIIIMTCSCCCSTEFVVGYTMLFIT